MSRFIQSNRRLPMLRPGYRCCESCERMMPTALGFEEYGSGYRRVCRDCRAISDAMRGWSASDSDRANDV
jgi:hypothetical protein